MTAAPSPPARTSATAGSGLTGVATQTKTRPPIARPSTPKTPTPALLRGWLIGTLIAVVVFTVAGVGTLVSARGVLSEAGQSLDQLSRVESIRTDVLRADAGAAHMLLGTQATDYQQALAAARETIVEAADGGSAEMRQTNGEALRAVNRELDRYANHLETARVERGTPAGVEALAAADRQLRIVVLPELDTLVNLNSARVARQTVGLSGDVLMVSGLVALVGLIGTSTVLGLRFRRLINPGLAGALVLVTAAFFFAQSSITDANTQVSGVARFQLATFEATAAARGLAYSARAYEAVALLERAEGEAGDEPWITVAQETTAALDMIPSTVGQELLVAWQDYATAHRDVRTAADQGQWDSAEQQVLSTAPDSAGGHFEVFDSAVTQAMTEAGDDAGTLIDHPRGRLTSAATGVGLAGVAVIALTVWGVWPRLREYA